MRNVQKLNVVHFSYKPEFSSLFGLSLREGDTGIIAQEVQDVLPEAVMNAGGIALPDGTVYDDFLVVNKVTTVFYKGFSFLTDNMFTIKFRRTGYSWKTSGP